MQERYEQAIKETFEYLDEYILYPPSTRTMQLKRQRGIDRVFVIETRMKSLGFPVYCSYTKDQNIISVFPKWNNLPIHIWRKKYVY